MKLKIQLKLFQDRFLFSEKRYPALIAGIGTGKTLCLLLKVWKFCETYPNTLALIVRKEYTDLKDSTLKDFESYFNVVVSSDKEYKFKNGSIIMFRHGAELNVLKNINLSIFAIEQAEEFETEEQFVFLRDRLRRKDTPYRQGCLIANANGHNWLWKLWKNNPASDDFHLETASTFDNADNLPDDFIADLKRMETEAPNHYKRYVLNSFEDMEGDDLVFSLEKINESIQLTFNTYTTTRRIMSVDIARYGDDESVATILESRGVQRWEQIFIEGWRQKNLMETTGRIIDLRRRFNVGSMIIDGDGMGAGVLDRLREMKVPVLEFRGGMKPISDIYVNTRAEGFFKLKEMLDRDYIKILPDEEQLEQLMTIRFAHKSNGQRLIVSKENMKKDGIKSPDRADALMMGVSWCERTKKAEETNSYLPRQAVTEYAEFLH